MTSSTVQIEVASAVGAELDYLVEFSSLSHITTLSMRHAIAARNRRISPLSYSDNLGAIQHLIDAKGIRADLLLSGEWQAAVWDEQTGAFITCFGPKREVALARCFARVELGEFYQF